MDAVGELLSGDGLLCYLVVIVPMHWIAASGFAVHRWSRVFTCGCVGMYLVVGSGGICCAIVFHFLGGPLVDELSFVLRL